MGWRAILAFQRPNSVWGKHAPPSSRVAGTYTCHSPSYERSSEPQPWIISSRSRSLSFSFLCTLHLHRTNYQVAATVSTVEEEKAKRWNTAVVSLCLTEESLQNWAQNLTLKEELMWAVRQNVFKAGRLWKGLWASLCNCKRAQKCVDTHHTLVKTLLPVISLCCGSAVC